MSKLVVYTLSNCDTCRAATKWLKTHDVAFEERAIRETPPTAAELRTMLTAYDGEVRRLCNVSGREYRALKLGEKLDGMTPAEVVELLAGNGSLVKRPFAIGRGVALIGFDEVAWRATLAKSK